MHYIFMNGLKLSVATEPVPIKNHVFSYCAVGWYIDGYLSGMPILCMIGYDRLKNPLGFIRLENVFEGVPLPRMISYGTMYRDEINSLNLKTRSEWRKRGYIVKDDAVGEMLFPSKSNGKMYMYYGRQEVEREMNN